MDEIGFKGYLAAISAFIIGVTGALAAVWSRLKKNTSEVNQAEKRTDAEIRRDEIKAKAEAEVAVEGRLAQQYERYFKRMDDDSAQLRKMVQDCQDDCDRREASTQARMERQTREFEEKFNGLLREHQQVVQTLSRLRGWLEAARPKIRKIGLEVPADDLFGSGIHAPLPPPPIPGEDGP